MMTARRRTIRFWGVLTLLLAGAAFLSASPASAQNRKKAWEVFIYFGEYGGQTVPNATQSGVISTYRLDPFLAGVINPDPNNPNDPNAQRFCVVCQNLGATGPTSQYLGPISGTGYTVVDACPLGSNGQPPPEAFDPNNPYLDECDDDAEARYVYNKDKIVTNGAVEKSSSEFMLGVRGGYNFTRHWEVEVDLGFTKQRLDMTQNLIPMLETPVSNPADPWFDRLANFYEFTWANIDYLSLGYNPVFNGTDPNIVDRFGGIQEIPNVPQRRYSKNAAADIPALLPMPSAAAETFDDVTDFVNRIFLDPTAFRNRANQINIDVFSLGLSGLYNFNTKPDSRFVPYVQGGIGRWFRGYDSPYKGEDTDYITYGAGARFFVNEIFAFRAEWRGVLFREDTSTITGELPKQNLIDFSVIGSGGCQRDQDPPAQQPPVECSSIYIDAFNQNQLPKIPKGTPAGGFASVEFETETNSFWEARIGFDVLLGGK